MAPAARTPPPSAAVARAEPASSSPSPSPETPEPYEAFKFVQSLADDVHGRRASLQSVGLTGVAALLGSAACTATITAYARSRSKAERDLPRGTHWRAAATACRALGVATVFTGVAVGVVFGVATARVVDSAESLRASLRGATRDAIAVANADGLRRGGR